MAGGDGGGDGRVDLDGRCGGALDGSAHCIPDGPDSPPLGSTGVGVESQTQSCLGSCWRTEISRISYALLLF